MASTSDDQVLKCHKSANRTCFGRLHATITRSQLNPSLVVATEATKKKTPKKTPKKSQPLKSTTSADKDDDSSSSTFADRLARFHEVDRLLRRRTDEFLAARDAPVLERVTNFIDDVKSQLPLDPAELGRDPFYRLPILVVRARESLPDYDALFDKISRLFNQLSTNVLRFSSYPGGALAGVLNQLAELRRVFHREYSEKDDGSQSARKPGRKSGGGRKTPGPKQEAAEQPLLLLDEIDGWPTEALNAVLAYCSRHAIVTCVRCVHPLHSYVSTSTQAGLAPTVVDAPSVTDAFSQLLVDLFIAPKDGGRPLPFVLSHSLFTFIRQRFNTCTHSAHDALNCIRLALLWHCVRVPSSVLLAADWCQVSERFGRLSTQQVWHIIQHTASVKEEVEYMTDLDERTLRHDLQECIAELDAHLMGYGHMLLAMYKLNVSVSATAAPDTPEQLVVFYERMLTECGRKTFEQRLTRQWQMWSLADLRANLTVIQQQLQAHCDHAHAGILKELRQYLAEIDKLDAERKQPLQQQQTDPGTPTSRLRQSEKRSWHQLKQTLETNMKQAQANDPVAKLKTDCLKWWLSACGSFCGSLSDYTFHEAFSVQLPDELIGWLHANTKQAVHAAAFKPQTYLSTPALLVAPLSLRVLCSLCEGEAGARRKSIPLSAWYKAWLACAKAVVPDGIDSKACFLTCVGCLEWLGAVRAVGTSGQGTVHKLYVPPIMLNNNGTLTAAAIDDDQLPDDEL